MGVTVTVDHSRRVEKDLVFALERFVTGALINIEGAAKPLTPAKTGTLRRSINVEMLSKLSGRVGTDVEYAPFVHDGTRRMAARPFLLQGAMAVEQRNERLLRSMLDGVR